MGPNRTVNLTKVAQDLFLKLHLSCASLMLTGTIGSKVITINIRFSVIQVASEIASVSIRPKTMIHNKCLGAPAQAVMVLHS